MTTDRGSARTTMVWRLGWSACVLLSGVLVVSGFGTAQPDSIPPLPEPGDYSNIGEHDTSETRCRDTPVITWRRCEGYSRERFPTSVASERDSRKLIEWFDSREWEEPTRWERRRPASAGGNPSEFPEMKVETIHESRRFSLKKLGKRGVVLARLTIRPGRLRDSLYGLGGAAHANFDTVYYLVADTLVENSTEETETNGPRREISNWYVLGVETINGERIVRRVGKTGKISWCGHRHSDQNTKAAFTTCLMQVAAELLRSDSSALAQLEAEYPGGAERGHSFSWTLEALTEYQAARSREISPSRTPTRLLLQILSLRRSEIDPVWITCGVGCCIAEL